MCACSGYTQVCVLNIQDTEKKSAWPLSRENQPPIASALAPLQVQVIVTILKDPGSPTETNLTWLTDVYTSKDSFGHKTLCFMFATINLPKIRIQENTFWKMLTRMGNSSSRRFHWSSFSSHKSQKKSCFSSDKVFFPPSDFPLLCTFLLEAFRVVFP